MGITKVQINGMPTALQILMRGNANAKDFLAQEFCSAMLKHPEMHDFLGMLYLELTKGLSWESA